MALPNTSEGRQLEAISRGATPDMTQADKSELTYCLKSIIADKYETLNKIQGRIDGLHELEDKLRKLAPGSTGKETL